MSQRIAHPLNAPVLVLALVLALAGALLTAGCRAPVPDGSGPDASPRAPRVRAALERMVATGGAPGGAALSRGADGPWFASTGYADIHSGRRLLEGDRFRAGSITKTFVATVTLQLVAEGRLALGDRVEDHLPGLLRGHGNDGRRITLRQLLGHTSGLFDYVEDPGIREESFGKGFAEHRYDTRTPRRLVSTALRHRPYFAPGTDYRYSNTDYVLLGLIIEETTGRRYADEIRDRIIEPLRLTGTSLPGSHASVPYPHGRAYSVAPGSRRLLDTTELDPSTAGAAGEAVSTLGDLNRFLGSLLRGELLPPEQLRQMRDTSRTQGAYGLGLFPVRLPCGVTLWGHNGSINGSYGQVLGTADGHHLFSYRVNTDSVGNERAETALLQAEFCKRSKPSRPGAAPLRPGAR